MRCKVSRPSFIRLFHSIKLFLDYAITNRLTPFISMQNHYALAYREEEREMMPLLKHLGVGSIPWSPLARGFLARPLGEQSKRGETDVYALSNLGLTYEKD